MKYFDFKAHDASTIHTSRIAIGSTMSMERLSSEEKFRLYDYFLDQGGNCIDTARAYRDGLSEEMVGTYLHTRGNRNRVVISTKGGHPGKDIQGSWLARENLLSELETSLKTLHTDHVDYYWVHKDDPNYPIEELVDTLNLIVKQGKARLVGASNFTTERFRAAAAYAKQTGQITFAASQIQWSLAATEDKQLEKFGSLTMTKERYDYYLENQIPVFAFSAQAQGFFQRVAAGGVGSVPTFIAEQYDSPVNAKRLELLQQYAQEHDCSLSAPALGYLIYNKLPCVAIIGASSVEMLAQSLEAVTLHMTAEEADALAQI